MKKKSILTSKKRAGVEKSGLSVKYKLRMPLSGKKRPRFESLTEAGLENPLDEFGDTLGLEGNSEREISAALQAVLNERAGRKDEFRIGRSRRYYSIICFQSEDQKKEFLDAIGWSHDRFLNGLEIAHSLGVEIEPINLPMRKYSKTTPKLLRKQEVIK